MILFKKFRISSPALFYSFRVILIVLRCSQVGMDGFRPVTANSSQMLTGSEWFWVVAEGSGELYMA